VRPDPREIFGIEGGEQPVPGRRNNQRTHSDPDVAVVPALRLTRSRAGWTEEAGQRTSRGRERIGHRGFAQFARETSRHPTGKFRSPWAGAALAFVRACRVCEVSP
jgi:hypothetical protein